MANRYRFSGGYFAESTRGHRYQQDAATAVGDVEPQRARDRWSELNVMDQHSRRVLAWTLTRHRTAATEVQRYLRQLEQKVLPVTLHSVEARHAIAVALWRVARGFDPDPAS